MALNLNTINGKLTPIGDRVLVSDMHFGEQRTKSGLIIANDDGQTRGIYPRWGKVHSKGPDNTDSYQQGNWVLIEHGRWTRGVQIEDNEGNTFKIRKVDKDSILLVSDEDQSDFSDK